MKKKEKLAVSIGDIDEKYVEEAERTDEIKKTKRKRLIIRLSVIAAAVSVLMVVLFVPFYSFPPSVSRYSGSDYYDIIQKLNKATYRDPGYKNNFERLLYAAIPHGNMNVDKAEEVAGDSAYQEVTDNQVNGVTEADRIKRSDRYVFYMYFNRIEVFELKDGDIENIGEYVPEYDIKDYVLTEMYLSADCSTLTLIIPSYGGYYGNYTDGSATMIISLDVSDPRAIVKKGEVRMNGGYLSSRVTDGRLMVFTRMGIWTNNVFSDEKRFIPQIDVGNGYTSIPADRIFCPEEISNPFYTTIYELDENSLALKDSISLLSYGSAEYVSKDSIYFSSRRGENSDALYKSVSDISRVSYGGEKMEYCGTVSVDGYVKDQYSMDEYDGVLRVVTTVGETRISGQDVYRAVSYRNASLYCIDIAEMKKIASVENFAPEGEDVKSVRFDKEKAYVCTSFISSDPVFFFDLSDIDNITVKDTGTIPGFSMSLINFGDGYLLGIGRGDEWGSLKVEVYKESDSEVVSVAAFEMPVEMYSSEYKSYFIDRENKLVGIPVLADHYDEQYERYVLLHFENENLTVAVDTGLAGGRIENKRAFLIDDTFYMFGELGCKTVLLTGQNEQENQ